MLGLISEKDILDVWEYQPGMDFEKLCQIVEASEKYSKGMTERQIEFLEVRLPLVIRDKCIPEKNTRFYIELDKIQDGKIVSIFKTNLLANCPTDEYATRLMVHLGAQRYRIIETKVE